MSENNMESEIERRIRIAKEAYEAMPDWAKRAAVFHGNKDAEMRGDENQ